MIVHVSVFRQPQFLGMWTRVCDVKAKVWSLSGHRQESHPVALPSDFRYKALLGGLVEIPRSFALGMHSARFCLQCCTKDRGVRKHFNSASLTKCLWPQASLLTKHIWSMPKSRAYVGIKVCQTSRIASGLQFIWVHGQTFLQMAIPHIWQNQSNLLESFISPSKLQYTCQTGLLAERSLSVMNLSSRIIFLLLVGGLFIFPYF